MLGLPPLALSCGNLGTVKADEAKARQRLEGGQNPVLVTTSRDHHHVVKLVHAEEQPTVWSDRSPDWGKSFAYRGRHLWLAYSTFAAVSFPRGMAADNCVCERRVAAAVYVIRSVTITRRVPPRTYLSEVFVPPSLSARTPVQEKGGLPQAVALAVPAPSSTASLPRGGAEAFPAGYGAPSATPGSHAAPFRQSAASRHETVQPFFTMYPDASKRIICKTLTQQGYRAFDSRKARTSQPDKSPVIPPRSDTILVGPPKGLDPRSPLCPNRICRTMRCSPRSGAAHRPLGNVNRAGHPVSQRGPNLLAQPSAVAPTTNFKEICHGR